MVFLTLAAAENGPALSAAASSFYSRRRQACSLKCRPPRRRGAVCRAVKLLAGLGNLALVAQRPVAERGHRLQQIAPERSQAVFDPRRNGGKYAARDQPVAFEAAQRQRHHQNRPLVADPGEHIAHRAAVRGQMLVSRFHGCAFLAGAPWVTYLALVTTCH